MLVGSPNSGIASSTSRCTPRCSWYLPRPAATCKGRRLFLGQQVLTQVFASSSTTGCSSTHISSSSSHIPEQRAEAAHQIIMVLPDLNCTPLDEQEHYGNPSSMACNYKEDLIVFALHTRSSWQSKAVQILKVLRMS
jgi:hypothetical protein